MRLCLFTNCTNGILERPTILETYESWVASFGKPENITIYIDPSPNPKYLKKYLVFLNNNFNCDVVITNGLADGYRRALDTKDDYLFMLEHDWLFEGVEHSLDYITGLMEYDKLWFMLFNKHFNDNSLDGTKWQSYFKDNGQYCLTDRVSNNPHIINRAHYLKKIAPLVDWTQPGAGKIEQVLQKKHEIAVYGGYGHAPTISHLNARREGKK